jgi:hypothetical protein
MQSQRLTKIRMGDAPPVMQVLLAQWSIQAVGMPQTCNVGRSCPFTKHLHNRIARNDVNQQKDYSNDEPEHWQCQKKTPGDVPRRLAKL